MPLKRGCRGNDCVKEAIGENKSRLLPCKSSLCLVIFYCVRGVCAAVRGGVERRMDVSLMV